MQIEIEMKMMGWVNQKMSGFFNITKDIHTLFAIQRFIERDYVPITVPALAFAKDQVLLDTTMVMVRVLVPTWVTTCIGLDATYLYRAF